MRCDPWVPGRYHDREPGFREFQSLFPGGGTEKLGRDVKGLLEILNAWQVEHLVVGADAAIRESATPESGDRSGRTADSAEARAPRSG